MTYTIQNAAKDILKHLTKMDSLCDEPYYADIKEDFLCKYEEPCILTERQIIFLLDFIYWTSEKTFMANELGGLYNEVFAVVKPSELDLQLLIKYIEEVEDIFREFIVDHCTLIRYACLQVLKNEQVEN